MAAPSSTWHLVWNSRALKKSWQDASAQKDIKSRLNTWKEKMIVRWEERIFADNTFLNVLTIHKLLSADKMFAIFKSQKNWSKF